MNPVHKFPHCLCKIHYYIYFPSRLVLPSGLFPSGFPNRILYTFLIYPMRATWPAHLILLDFSTLTILAGAYFYKKNAHCILHVFMIKTGNIIYEHDTVTEFWFFWCAFFSVYFCFTSWSSPYFFQSSVLTILRAIHTHNNKVYR